MKIGPVNHRQEMPPTDQPKQNRPADTTAPRTARDEVIISDEARARLAELADAALDEVGTADPGADDAASSLTPKRLAELRERMASGFYDLSRVQDVIADRLADDLIEQDGGETGNERSDD